MDGFVKSFGNLKLNNDSACICGCHFPKSFHDYEERVSTTYFYEGMLNLVVISILIRCVQLSLSFFSELYIFIVH